MFLVEPELLVDERVFFARSWCRNEFANHGLLISERFYPICRSITGNGVRQTLEHIRLRIPLDLHEVPTGTPVFD